MNFRAPLLVGLLLIGATVSTTWFVVSTSEDKFNDDSTYTLLANFDDASGIRWKTRVQINGIDVGKIESIKHIQSDEGDLVAQIELRILKDFRIFSNASLMKTAESLLGDFRLDLRPGSSKFPQLPPGGLITDVKSVSDLEEIQDELKHVAQNVNRITHSFQSVLSGPEGEGSLQAILNRMEKSMEAIELTTRLLSRTMKQNDGHIDGILSNINTFSSQLVNVMSKDGAVGQTTNNIAQLSLRLSNLADQLAPLIEAGDSTVHTNSPLGTSLNNFNQSIEHLNSIVQKIDQGEGTAGRLINDSAIAEKVERTLTETNDLIGNLAQLQTRVELRTEYGVPFDGDNKLIQKAIKNTLGLHIVPRPDKYYILEAVADPRGLQTRTITTESQTGGEFLEQEVISTSFDELKFSAQMAKRYYFLALRFGIIENTGGMGINLFGLNDRLELRFDIFDFDRRKPEDNESIFPRLRGAALAELYNHIYLQAGIDDPLNDQLRTWFLGGVLRFTDEDLKTLMTFAPSPF